MGRCSKPPRALRRHSSDGARPGNESRSGPPNRPEWVLLRHGLSMAGLIMVTLNPAYRRHELGYVLRQSRCAGVCFSDEHRGGENI